MNRLLYLALRVVCPLFLLLGGASYAQKVGVMVKFDIERHDGSVYTGAISVRPASGGRTIHGHANEYGLAFIPLDPSTEYAVSFPGFPNLSRFTTPPHPKNEMSLDIRLPDARLSGIPMAQGRGVVLFTYLDTEGRGMDGEELVCRDEQGRRFSKSTGYDGTLRLDLPLGHTYRFSVKGAKDFSSHTFAETPSLQTAEINLRMGNRAQRERQRAARRKPPRRSHNTMGERAQAVHSRPIASRSDSVNYAKRSIKAASRGKRYKALVIPPRKKPTPQVSKRVVEGVYMMRQAYGEAYRDDPKIVGKIRMELFRPLLRANLRNVVFVIDVTCSMDPYLEEYLLWLSLARNSSRVLGCIFFNDGDGRPLAQKKIGATGGIRVSSANMDSTVNTLVASLAYGCSGDDAENDLEALLFAQWRFPEASALVLVADNTSAVRDIELLPQLHMPVHVFLCGAESAEEKLPPHEDYVSIAVRTGGSLHFLSEDIAHRKLQLNDQQLRIGKWEYLLLKGHFRRLNE